MERCFCSACVPTAAPLVCSRCGEEIRWGARESRLGYWHREAVDHQPIHGHMFLAAEQERAAQHLAQWREAAPVEPEPTEDEDEDELEDVEIVPLPEPEIPRHDVTAEDFPPRSGIRQIVNLVTKTPGWELVRFTHARGPWIGSKGTMLSVSDSVVLGARGPEGVDGVPIAVGTWRDGAFKTAYTGVLKAGHLTTIGANSKALKTWIKEHSA